MKTYEDGFAAGVEFAAKVMRDLGHDEWAASAIRLRAEKDPKQFEGDPPLKPMSEL